MNSRLPDSLQARDLAGGFASKHIFEKAAVTLLPGQIIVIAGQNGVGKSTLVKTLARQVKPLQGTVSFGETDIWTMSAREFAAKVAYVPQSMEPASDLTVRELVMLGRNPHQKWWQWQGTTEDMAAVEKALADADLNRLEEKSIDELSGGERQRVAIGTALAQNALFMLLDEPTAHLDYKHQIALIHLIKRLKQNGPGFIVVLHDLNMIAELADEVILLQPNADGPSTIGASGSTESVLKHTVLKRIFDVDVGVFVDPETGKTVYNPLRSGSGSCPG